MSHRKKASPRARRGFSLAEMLAVVVIFGLISTFAALVIGPMLSAPNAEQAKVDTVDAAAQALYELQRDIRVSDPSGVFTCTMNPPPLIPPVTPPYCTSPTQVMADTPILALLTPRTNGNGGLNWDPNNGQQAWQGFNVYWLVPNSEASNDVMYAFASVNIPNGSPTVDFATADNAVKTAMQSTSARVIARNVSGFQTSITVATRTVGLQIFSKTTVSGKQNQTTFRGDAVARN